MLVTLVDVAKTFVGSRVRQLRSERGFSQAALAQMLEISPSYLNQIEHDVRPLTVAVLLRITEVFGVDATFFASQDDTRLVAELREVTMDRDLEVADIDLAEVADMVSAHPGLARAMVNLHRRYRLTTTQLAAATEDRYSDGSGSGSITMPHEEVRDYFYQRQNYLHELDTAAEELTVRMRMHRGDLAGELADRLTIVHGVRIVKRIDLGDTVLHRYEPASKTLEISNHLSTGQQVFKMAAELAYLEFGELIDTMVDEGKFTSDESRTLARLGLANYFAAATVLPYRQFHDVAENFRYDIERLSAFYSVSYETIGHRLSTLQRPSMRGVPFSFVRVDRAGNMSKRQSATGFHFSSSGGTCPLWNVYETFANPGKILVQIAQMPDGRNYMWVARTVERRASRFGQPGKTFAIGLGCELRHAHRLVYSEGLDLSGDDATPIGAGCRVCERDNCPAARVSRAGPRSGPQRAPQHGVALPGQAAVSVPARIPSTGSLRELGLINWAFCEAGRPPCPDFASAPVHHAWHTQAAAMDLATVRRRICCTSASSRARTPNWSSCVSGICATASTNCSSTAGWPRCAASSSELQAKIFEGPDAEGLTDRQRALITATDEFVITRSVSPETWAALSGHLDRSQLIEFCTLAGQYDALAATLATLKIPLDFPD